MSGLREIRAFLYSLLNEDNTYIKSDIYYKESNSHKINYFFNMLLKDTIQKQAYGLVETISDQNRNLLNDFGSKLEYPQVGYTPDRIYYDYWNGDDSPMSKLNQSLAKDYPIIINNGYNHTDSFLTLRVKNVTIGSIIMKRTGKKFQAGRDRFKKY